MNYEISEIFYSIQGEGLNTGLPCVFIRFSGCNLNCKFCDEFLHKQKGTFYSLERLIDEVNSYAIPNIVLTGGEPTLQVDEKLVKVFKSIGKRLYLETNGTNPVPNSIDWVTVSPKTRDFVFGNELKIVYYGQDMSPYENSGFDYNFLQPLSNQNIDECLNYIRKNPKWRLSIQLHKVLNIK